MPINMGIGRLGGDSVIHKRKFRWTFKVIRKNGDVPASFVKIAKRPSIEIEETEINFLNAKTWIPGKGVWQTIEVTYYDVAVINGQGNENLWTWLASVYDFTDNVGLRQSTKRECYGGEGVMILYDGCGTELEEWRLFDCWPQNIDFGELDYSQSEEVNIVVTIRYSNVKYTVKCGNPWTAPQCCGCSNVSSGSTQAVD